MPPSCRSLLMVLPLFTGGAVWSGVLVGSLVFGLYMKLMLETLFTLLLFQLGEADVAVFHCLSVCFIWTSVVRKLFVHELHSNITWEVSSIGGVFSSVMTNSGIKWFNVFVNWGQINFIGWGMSSTTLFRGCQAWWGAVPDDCLDEPVIFWMISQSCKKECLTYVLWLTQVICKMVN